MIEIAVQKVELLNKNFTKKIRSIEFHYRSGEFESLRVRNFNFKSDSGFSTHTQIGLIAQETPIHFAKPVPPWNLK